MISNENGGSVMDKKDKKAVADGQTGEGTPIKGTDGQTDSPIKLDITIYGLDPKMVAKMKTRKASIADIAGIMCESLYRGLVEALDANKI